MGYDFEIYYNPGKENTKADALPHHDEAIMFTTSTPTNDVLD